MPIVEGGEETMPQLGTNKRKSLLLARALENARKYPAYNKLKVTAGYNDGSSYSDGYCDAGYGDQSYGEGPNG